MARSSRWMAVELLSDFSRAPVLDSHRSYEEVIPQQSRHAMRSSPILALSGYDGA
jgi:hypothetical protein